MKAIVILNEPFDEQRLIMAVTSSDELFRKTYYALMNKFNIKIKIVTENGPYIDIFNRLAEFETG